MNALDAFKVWYAAYPRKTAKKEAEKAFVKHYRDMPPMDQMLKILEAQKRLPQWLKDDGEFIPYPATYLNRGQWEDEIKIEMPKDIVNEKPWDQTATGIETKGAELGLHPSQFASWPAFKEAVMQRAKGNVYQLKSA